MAEKKGFADKAIDYIRGGGPLGWFGGKILAQEEVVDDWSILVEKGKWKAEEVFKDIETYISESKVPALEFKRRKMVPGVVRGVLGTKREFLVVTYKSFRLKPYQVFINARDFGENLDVSWYLTYRLPIWRALFKFIPGISEASTIVELLDLFDRQDLTAYATICHYSTISAVEKQMKALNQDTSKINRKSKGFLGIS